MGEERLRAIANGRDPCLMQGHLLHNSVVQEAFVHIDLVEEAREDQYDLVRGKAFYLGEPAVADIEVAVAIAPDLGLAVFVLVDTRLACLLHSAYSRVVKDIRRHVVAKEAVVAFPLVCLKIVNSSSAYEDGS